MIAKFKTERVEYVIDAFGYSRNGAYVPVSCTSVTQLEIGKNAVVSYKIGETYYVMETDPVISITFLVAPHQDETVKDTAKVYRVRVSRNERKLLRYLIGSRNDVADRAAKHWPEALIVLEPCRGIYKSIAN